MIVNIIPVHIEYQLFSFDISEYNGTTTPITSPAKHSFDKSKKYAASFSRLVLSFSLPSRFSSCFLSQLPIRSDFQLFIHFGKRPKVKQCLFSKLCLLFMFAIANKSLCLQCGFEIFSNPIAK